MAKMNKFSKKAAELEAWGELLTHAQNQLRYYTVTKLDENGNPVEDENGNEVQVPPTEDSYNYSQYIGWSEVIKALEAMKI